VSRRFLRARSQKHAQRTIVDRKHALRTGLKTGDKFYYQVNPGTKEEFYTLTVVVSATAGSISSVLPSSCLPPGTNQTAARLDDKQVNSASANLTANVVAVQLENPGDWKAMARRLENQVSDVEAVDRQTAYQASQATAPSRAP